jgi:O-succinylbenzoate synthase
MRLKIYYYRIKLLTFLPMREGFLIETENGWSEVSPLPNYSSENLNDALEQLRALQEGRQVNFLPSVAFGLFSVTQAPVSWPASALFMGTKREILEQADKSQEFSTAKIKVKNLPLADAIDVVKNLKNHFRLRIDANGSWPLAQALEFCSHFHQDDFDYIEDPVSDPKDLSHFPFPVGLDAQQSPIVPKAQIWKPTVKGIPAFQDNLVLSSAFETGIGIGKLVQLAATLKLPKHPIGLGTYHYLSEAVLEEPLTFSNGMVHVPKLKPNLKHVQYLP